MPILPVRTHFDAVTPVAVKTMVQHLKSIKTQLELLPRWIKHKFHISWSNRNRIWLNIPALKVLYSILLQYCWDQRGITLIQTIKISYVHISSWNVISGLVYCFWQFPYCSFSTNLKLKQTSHWQKLLQSIYCVTCINHCNNHWNDVWPCRDLTWLDNCLCLCWSSWGNVCKCPGCFK